MKRPAAIPSLFAPQLPETVRYYVETLGFTQTGSYEDTDGSEIWAEVALGEARIWFFSNSLQESRTPAMSGLIYLFVDDVDSLASRIGKDVDLQWGPETQEYGLRELGIKDLNGYYLVFAKDV